MRAARQGRLHGRGTRWTLLQGIGWAATAASALALEASPLITSYGATSGERLGWDVAAAGDVNGDGWLDFVAGAPRAGVGAPLTGRVLVWFGGPTADAQPDLVLIGEAGGDRFGQAVAGVGDLDGDGFDDIAVGAPYADGGGPADDDRGRVYVFRGGNPAGVAPPDSLADIVLTGEAPGDQFGWSLAGSDDLDGDGGADLLVGAPAADGAGGLDHGRDYLFRGGVALDATPDLTVTGTLAGGMLGWSVCGLADFDGDGSRDFAAGALLASRVALFRGGAALDAGPDQTILGEDGGDRFGYAIADAGDMNGDGRSDLVVGALLNDAGAPNAGRVYVFHGATISSPTLEAGAADRVYTGTTSDEWLGRAVAGAGDLDRDGLADVIMGAPGEDVGAATPGAVYVFLGSRPTGELPTGAADLAITGTEAGDRFGHSVAAGRDGTSEGSDHLLVGSPLARQAGSVSGCFVVYRVTPPGNRAPVAWPDAWTVAQGDSLTVPAPGALANDADVDGDTLSARLVRAPVGGALALLADGGFAYRHGGGPAVPDTFSYAADDGRGGSDPTLVVLTILDATAPPAIAAAAAAAGPGRIGLTWTDPAVVDLAGVEIWRARWNDSQGGTAWPAYDDAPGSAPPVRPVSRAEAAAGGVWTSVAFVAGGAGNWADTDTALATRGVYHYELFARDEAGNYGPPMATGVAAASYRLADIAQAYDGQVSAADVSALAAAFGTVAGGSGWNPEADYGPTTTGTPRGVPLTDGVIGFEDLVICAMSFDDAATTQGGGEPLPPLQLVWTWMGGTTWSLQLAQPHPAFQALRLRGSFGAGEVLKVAAGELLGTVATPWFLRNTLPGGLDASLAVLGTGQTVPGFGELLRVTLAHATAPKELLVDARSPANAPLAVSVRQSTDVPATDAAFALRAHPNPFNPSTRLSFSLPVAQRARVVVHAADGRLVAVLHDGPLASGSQAFAWDGRDARGRPLASGVYLARLDGETVHHTEELLLAK